MPLTSIDGISSGLNTTEIINSILQYERRPAVLMERQVAEKTNIVTTYKAFQAKLLALATQTRSLSRATTFEATDVSVSDDSYLTATASGRVGSGSYDIQVQALARNHQIASQGFDDESLAQFGTGTISISVGDGATTDITIDAGNNSLTGIKNAINSADAGVRASIVNDGSESNPYRLVLSADKTGVKNRIHLESNLTGDKSLNFTTATFDNPEAVSVDAESDATLALGATAAYTGTTNKTYTFTVAGTGQQTVGSDNIVLDWTDGTNSGSIVVTQADTEVELVGEGADGLKLTFSSGQLQAGDTFQVGTFAPLLQDASDARLAIGSSDGGGSPITITSETNEFKQVISGLSLTAGKVTPPGETVSLKTDIDVAAIKETIQGLLTKLNDVNKFVDSQNDYNADTGEAGTLLGDYSVQMMQYSLRRAIANPVAGLESKYNQLATIGIRTNAQGQLTVRDSSALENAIRNNLDDVINLFVDSGNSSTESISFVSATARTKVGEAFDVDITKAATRGQFRGMSIDSPYVTPLTLDGSNNRLRLSMDGVESEEIILSERTYDTTEELVTEIQNQIDNDAKLGTRGLTVEWVETGADSGYLAFSSSTYGSSSSVNVITSVTNSAAGALGLATGVSEDGVDVEGTINGEAAEGTGQLLKGKEGNATTEGLQLRITLDTSQVTDGAEGSVTIAKGIASRLDDTVDSLSQAGSGMLDVRIKGVQGQIDNLNARIGEFDQRLELRRERLLKDFYAMEQAIGQMNSIGSFLSSKIASLDNNWKFNQGG
ncbi:flagellar filament capping protein FliD [candidate division GN15 bacterium]|nr:flagellar filament capping protein FliD [candidate division GN15 bacterium]